ncbi:MAG: cysteine--tRNA ligase [Candidatus Pacebacteria bacterium]|jgi:cysteinyl-tRNA synthetase|nr:cysteine--tRNA ligase [Candidatus Paceibacterota bacterium]
MDINFYNTLTGKKEKFVPLHKEFVGLYNCGPTVYQYAHIGNLRSYVFADILRRTLEFNGLHVRQVINITDVGHLTDDADSGEDKVEKEAKKDGRGAKEITAFYTEAFLKDVGALNMKLDGTRFTPATEHIREQIELIQRLEEKKCTYQTSDGVYFDTNTFPAYGKLGNINIKGLKEGARIDINDEKKNPTDFALWKFSKPEEHRQQEWPSPWGVGFPGWHIECSAMSMKYLGENFDIHTGGVDHIPTHHNGEIAQSEAATGKPYANYWLHNEHLMINGEKISKSLGNSICLSDIIAKNISPLAYRFWLLMASYRTQINFNWDALLGAETALKRLYALFRALGEVVGIPSVDYCSRFKACINDDLDTPRALTLVWEVLKDKVLSSADKRATLLAFDAVLGLNLSSLTSHLIPENISLLLEERKQARKSGDWATADRIRDELKSLGYEIKDTQEGVQITHI